MESPPKSRLFLWLAWNNGQKRKLNGLGPLAGASCVNVVRKQWIMYCYIVLYLRLSGMNHYNYFWNKKWDQSNFVDFFSNGYLINMKKDSRFFLSLWILKNSTIFQGMELNTDQESHKIWASIKVIWNPLKEKYQRILEKPNLQKHANLWGSALFMQLQNTNLKHETNGIGLNQMLNLNILYIFPP